ncbi:MAG: SemiSWEET family sugar transporter [Flavobacteriales bacterium]|jgi:MtN3 and saliva related transmembrane protein|nr:SemiSWEET transporter [Flavobacteriaceae bacterium]MDO7582355.1 SemiSWEET transporter [Flavobacteriaceae bacterium]MDO7592114.1 SemiSWEET transporter [Flavobacteriaceae bacterium]MDO7599987.1 SemiSWEET transporter [Flavobacteriaceae bacterium]MDO7602626.1 SemiSWEET transporter [Flavobacteriaceae bacterium]|tara:strand:+ start:1644 stop:1913 length:270 start_codon:yes stop_codon:yes gene_type:complete
MNYEIIGFIAAILTTSSFLPQLIKVWKTKSSKGVSTLMYFVMLSGVILWGVYGYLIGSKSVLIANIVAGLLQIVILILIFKNKNNESTN